MSAVGAVGAVRTVAVVGGVVALVALGAVAASLAGGGGANGSANGAVPVDDVGVLVGSWRVVNDVSATAPVLGIVTLEFTPEGRVVAETGCNIVRGTATVEDSVLVTGPLMSTRMACEPALMEQGRWVTEMLSSRPRLELSGPYLALHWGEGGRWWLGLERG
jgi:heat shock protein HslJ